MAWRPYWKACGAALAKLLRRNQVLEALLLTEDHLGTEAVPLGLWERWDFADWNLMDL